MAGAADGLAAVALGRAGCMCTVTPPAGRGDGDGDGDGEQLVDEPVTVAVPSPSKRASDLRVHFLPLKLHVYSECKFASHATTVTTTTATTNIITVVVARTTHPQKSNTQMEIKT